MFGLVVGLSADLSQRVLDLLSLQRSDGDVPVFRLGAGMIAEDEILNEKNFRLRRITCSIHLEVGVVGCEKVRAHPVDEGVQSFDILQL